MTALILSGDRIDRILSGKTSLIIQHSQIDLGDLVELFDGQEVRGTIQLGKAEKIDLLQFAALAGQHGLTETDRIALWPRAKRLLAYPIVSIEAAAGLELDRDQTKKLIRAQQLARAWIAAIPGFVDRQLRFLRETEGNEQAIAFLEALHKPAEALRDEIDRLQPETAEPQTEPETAAVPIARELIGLLSEVIEFLPEDFRSAIQAGIDAASGLVKLSESELLSDGGHFKIELSSKGIMAPIYPSGETSGKGELSLADVLGYIKPFAIRRGAVSLVGGLANWGKTSNDVDILIRGPLDEGTRHVLEFRLGRSMPAEISQRIQFLNDELGGPFTTHVELGELYFVPRTHKIVDAGTGIEAFQLVEMIAKQDPLMELPPKRGPYQAVFQFHYRGASLHGDLRMRINDHAVGWTLNNQISGKVPKISELREARRLARRFDQEGNFFLKSWVAPNGLLAEPKSKMPLEWLAIEAEKYEPGEIGATANEPGFIVRVSDSDLKVEYGLQKAWAHEYFFHGDPKFSGRLFFRLLAGGGSQEEDKIPQGETFWRSFWTVEQLPSVLTKRAVETESMPPDGYSALPVSLEEVTPSEFRYWEHKGAEARRVREALVDSGFFKPDNVRLVDGQIRRVIAKYYLDLGGSESRKIKRARYAIAWQYWKGQQVIRAAPSRQVWHLLIENPTGGIDAWKLQADPLAGNHAISGMHRQISNESLLTFDGEAEPGKEIGGEILNDTKATPSWIRHVDDGQIEEIERTPDLIRVKLSGGKLRGEISLQREEPGSDFWLFEASEKTAKIETDGRGQGAAIFVDRQKGLAFVACPLCDSVHLRKTGQTKRFQEGVFQAIECNHCDSIFGLDVEPLDRNEIVKDDSGAWESVLKKAPRDSITSYVLLKEIPMKDGIQIWDPKRKDPEVDRSDLKPLAIYQPMKAPSRPTNIFRDRADLDQFATETMLNLGLMIEPKWNGFRLSLQKHGNKTLIFTEDEKRDLSKTLPGLVSELLSIPGDFVIDGEGMALDSEGHALPRRELTRYRGTKPVDDTNFRVFVFDALYLPQAGNITSEVQSKRRQRLDGFMKTAKASRVILTPFKVVRDKAALERAIDWASSEPGSEGAMLKSVEATYSLSGENDGWAKIKLSRELKAIIYDRHPVKDSPGVFNFFGAIGPISESEAKRWAEAVEVKGKKYVAIGKTFNSKLSAEVGETILVEFLELLLDESGRRIRWFTPTVIDKIDEDPTSLEEVKRLLRPGEVKKTISILKTKEERFVLGIVLEPNDGQDGAPLDPDSQRDIYSLEEVRQTAHDWMENYGHRGVMHRYIADGQIKILESYLAPCDFELETPDGKTIVRRGTWLLAIRVLDDELWQKVKLGEMTGFSIGGDAIRTRA